MNLFIFNFKLFFFTVIFIISFGLISFCIFSEFIVVSNKKKSSYEIIKKKYHNAFQTEYVVFADSHGFSGISETDNLINYSFAGDNLLTIVKKISFFIDRNKVKGVIIQADPHQLAMYRLTKNQDQLVDDFLNEKDYKLNFYRSPYRQYLKNYWFDFFKSVFFSKYSDKVVNFLEFAILATFFAGSTPIAFNPNLFIGSKNIPSLLPISTKTEFLLRFKSVFNSFASSIKWSLNCWEVEDRYRYSSNIFSGGTTTLSCELEHSIQ